MEKQQIITGRMNCIICAIIIFGCYAAQKAISIGFESTRELAIVQALVFSMCVAIVYFLVTKSDDSFYGILASIFGFRMLPPVIPSLSKFSMGADVLYLIVGKISLLIFALAIIKLYSRQKGDNKIQVLPIICLMVFVPYFMEMSEAVGLYLSKLFKTMIGYYFSEFAFYTVAMIATLMVGLRSSKASARLIADYQIVALLVNIGRKACAAIVMLVNNTHVSKSYYCWIAIYIFFVVVFYLFKKRCEGTKHTEPASTASV